MKTQTRILGALLASALLAACGGGGKTAALPASATGAPSNGGTQQPSSGARFTIKINRSKKTAHRLGAALRRTAASTRSPKYIANTSEGLQVTITSGSTTKTAFYSLVQNGTTCTTDSTTDVETCTYVFPTVGATENITVLETDQAPNADPTSGAFTGIPSNANTLAVGTQNNVVIGSGYTDLSISMNPVSAGFTQNCGNYVEDTANNYNGSDAEPVINGNTYVRGGMDTKTTPARVVVTANVPLTASVPTQGNTNSPVFFAPPSPVDIDGDCFNFIGYNSDGTSIGQPLVDTNGTPTATTITSSSTHLKMVNWMPTYFYGQDGYAQGTNFGPEPGATPASTVSITNSAEFLIGCFFEAMVYDGNQTTSSTITLKNNQMATPPTYTGTPTSGGAPATSYAATLTYEFAPLSTAPSTLAFSTAAPQVVTATDPDATFSVDYDSNCNDSNGNTLATISSTTANQLTVTPVAQGSCQFAVVDDATGVATAVNVTSTYGTVFSGSSARRPASRVKGVRLR